MDADEPHREPRPADPPEAAGDAAAPRPAPPTVTPLELPPPRAAAGLPAGCRRPALIGALTLTLLLVVLMVIGVQLTRRTMWLTADRALGRIRRAALDAPLEPAERTRLLAALDRFGRRVPLMDDPYPAIGAFLGRAQSDLADGRLSRDEALGLTELLEPLASGEAPR